MLKGRLIKTETIRALRERIVHLENHVAALAHNEGWTAKIWYVKQLEGRIVALEQKLSKPTKTKRKK